VDQFEARSGLEDRRRRALQAYLDGDYPLAEQGLRSLLEEGFDVPSTHCHLVRLLMVQDRLEEAWTEIAAAWEHRADAPPYIVPRILWLHVALLYLAPAGEDLSSSIQLSLGYLKTSLGRKGAQMEWRMEPLLPRLHQRLPAEEYQLLAALVAALSDETNIPDLEQFPDWRDTKPKPLE
jgi:hypothetical protein